MTARLILTAVCSGSGKTMLTSALAEALSRRGMKVQCYKCGPDHIDSCWHRPEAETPSHNLDAVLMAPEELQRLFAATATEINLIEGVMGYFDGQLQPRSWPPRGSTAEIARILAAPRILILPVKGLAQSLLAVIDGFCHLDPELAPDAILLNRCSAALGTELKLWIEERLGIPVLGIIPDDDSLHCSERKQGLCLPGEANEAKWQKWADLIEQSVDLEAVLALAGQSQPLLWMPDVQKKAKSSETRPLLAVARDDCFPQPYPWALQALEEAGAEIRFWQPLLGEDLPPEASGLYMSQGAPERFAERLSEQIRKGCYAHLQKAVGAGLPLLVEGSALAVWAENLRVGDRIYPMLGRLSGCMTYTGRLQHFGYAEASLPDGEGVHALLQAGEKMPCRSFHCWSYENSEHAGRLQLVKGQRSAWRDDFGQGGQVLMFASCHLAHAHYAERWVQCLRTSAQKESQR